MLPWFKKGITKGLKENLEPAIQMGIYLFVKRVAKETPYLTAIEMYQHVQKSIPQKVILDSEELNNEV